MVPSAFPPVQSTQGLRRNEEIETGKWRTWKGLCAIFSP